MCSNRFRRLLAARPRCLPISKIVLKTNPPATSLTAGGIVATPAPNEPIAMIGGRGRNACEGPPPLIRGPTASNCGAARNGRQVRSLGGGTNVAIRTSGLQCNGRRGCRPVELLPTVRSSDRKFGTSCAIYHQNVASGLRTAKKGAKNCIFVVASRKCCVGGCRNDSRAGACNFDTVGYGSPSAAARGADGDRPTAWEQAWRTVEKKVSAGWQDTHPCC
jgi:hypothetical protein